MLCGWVGVGLGARVVSGWAGVVFVATVGTYMVLGLGLGEDGYIYGLGAGFGLGWWDCRW